MSNVFILVDLQGDAVSKTTAELATAGARMGDVTAIVLTQPGKSAAIVSALTGPISSVISIESEDLATHGVPAYADLISQIVTEKKPSALLIASHAFGKEIAGRVAIATDSGIITDAVDVAADGTATQLVFGGSTTVHSKISHGVSIMTIRPNTIEANTATASPTVENVTKSVSDVAKKVRITATQPFVNYLPRLGLGIRLDAKVPYTTPAQKGTRPVPFRVHILWQYHARLFGAHAVQHEPLVVPHQRAGSRMSARGRTEGIGELLVAAALLDVRGGLAPLRGPV